ncbi:MAG: nitrite/sulfite reductase [Bacteroidia bacterium]|nr:nitrite/sulfite reductase [Bacteroidia bacterium]
MISFQTELENPIVQKDIIELEKKIRQYREGTIDPDQFRSLRLARGIYGQRQQGVQMVRIKLPFGKITPRQLRRIADISDEYSNGNLHLTTRQDIQIHHVSLERTPELWSLLEKDALTIREACGNTLRNVTASAEAGIDPQEPFDVSPYAQAVFEYFLRKPFGQEMGRKFKISFSSNENDTAFAFIHDIGFIPKVKIINGVVQRGFKVVIGGGLGAQPFSAQTAYEFLEEYRIIPFAEAVMRVFDRYGERNNRHKARLKYLLAQTGLEIFLEMVKAEAPALQQEEIAIRRDSVPSVPPSGKIFTSLKPSDPEKFRRWTATNTFEQKQQGYYGVYIRVTLGNITSALSREVARIAEAYAAEELRVTVNQGLLLKFVPSQALPSLFRELDALGLALPGFTGAGYITACPGTDTCNLGISSSTGITRELEKVISEEYPDLIYRKDLKIKISGCMNSCGQHSLAQIGFHGSSIKEGNTVIPALLLLLGGGALGNGSGRFAEKILKFPSRRGPDLLRALLNDILANAANTESFNAYFDRKGKEYFYHLLKIFSDTSSFSQQELMDWGQEEKFKPVIGVGECAGVQIDLVQTLFLEADEKLQAAQESFLLHYYADAVYYAYAALIHSAKAALLSRKVYVNSQDSVLRAFDTHLGDQIGPEWRPFRDFVLAIRQKRPDLTFATAYLAGASDLIKSIRNIRLNELSKSSA